MSSITITITGQDNILHNGIITFAKANGWKDTVLVNGEETANPVTAAEFCAAPISTFFLDKIVEGATKMAEDNKLAAVDNVKKAFSTVQFSVSKD